MTLKRSSIIYYVYIGKNIMEIFLVSIYVAVNIAFALQNNDPVEICEVKIKQINGKKSFQ